MTSSDDVCPSNHCNTSMGASRSFIGVLFANAAQQTEITYIDLEYDLGRQDVMRQDKAVVSHDEVHDDDQLCRICFGGGSAEQLIKPCRCRGTFANVHRNCLERWLLQAATSRCEVCRHHYAVVRTPKSNLLRSLVDWTRLGGGRALATDSWRLLVLGTLNALGTLQVGDACERVLEAGAQCGGSALIYAHLARVVAIGIIAASNGLLTTWTIIRVQAHQNSWERWRNSTGRVRVILGDGEQQENDANAKVALVKNSSS